MRILELNHVAILVSDIERSRRFYLEVLGLEPIPRPAFDFPGAWFRIGAPGPGGAALQELHLIARRPENFTRPRDRHFAVSGAGGACAASRQLSYTLARRVKPRCVTGQSSNSWERLFTPPGA